MVVEKAFCKTIFLHLIIKWLQTSFLTAFNEQKNQSIIYKSYGYLVLVYLLLRHMGWFEAADLIIKGTEGAIQAKTVTYDFERLMEGAKLLKCSEFGDAIIHHM